MAFVANKQSNFELWDFIVGDYYNGLDICSDRYYYLYELDSMEPIKISIRDPDTNNWTKWNEFPQGLINITKSDYGKYSYLLSTPIDVHRSILSNEIVVESDYPTYEENYQAARIIGQILESKGFEPLYYYSGNKSIHIHIFFDWASLNRLDGLTKDILSKHFKGSILRFKKQFMHWLRTKIISCWGLGIKKFDSDLINASHLIRSEMSRNKLGFKTFIGYTYLDLTPIPYVCNENNRIYPKIGEIRLSYPWKIQDVVEEFIEFLDEKNKITKNKKKNRSLADFGISHENLVLRGCAKMILSEEFKKAGDGFQRGMFILLNELRRVMGDEQARIIIHDWNSRMGFPIKDQDIDYRFKTKMYSLSCKYIHSFLKDLGFDVDKKCKGKV